MCCDTFTMMCLSLGTKIGVMDKMLSYDEPKTCKEIADDAGLKERWELKLFSTLKLLQFFKNLGDDCALKTFYPQMVLSK